MNRITPQMICSLLVLWLVACVGQEGPQGVGEVISGKSANLNNGNQLDNGADATSSAQTVSGSQKHWFQGNVSEAFSKAAEEGKSILLYWGAEWCPPCHELKDNVFSHPEFSSFARGFVSVYLDGDRERAQAWGERLSVSGYPTVLLLEKADGPMKLKSTKYVQVGNTSFREVARLGSGLTFSEFTQAVSLASEQNVRLENWVKLLMDSSRTSSIAINRKDFEYLSYFSERVESSFHQAWNEAQKYKKPEKAGSAKGADGDVRLKHLVDDKQMAVIQKVSEKSRYAKALYSVWNRLVAGATNQAGRNSASTFEAGLSVDRIWDRSTYASAKDADIAAAENAPELIPLAKVLFEASLDYFSELEKVTDVEIFKNIGSHANSGNMVPEGQKNGLSEMVDWNKSNPLLDRGFIDDLSLLNRSLFRLITTNSTARWESRFVISYRFADFEKAMKHFLATETLSSEKLTSGWLNAARKIRDERPMTTNTKLWTYFPEVEFIASEVLKDRTGPVSKSSSNIAEGGEKNSKNAVKIGERSRRNIYKVADYQADLERVVNDIEAVVARAKTKHERGSTVTGAAYLLRKLEAYQSAETILQKELGRTSTPWYVQRSLASLAAAKGDQRTQKKWSREAAKSAVGNATKLQWLSLDIATLEKMGEAKEEIETRITEFFKVSKTTENAFSGRNLAAQKRVAKVMDKLASKVLTQAATGFCKSISLEESQGQCHKVYASKL